MDSNRLPKGLDLTFSGGIAHLTIGVVPFGDVEKVTGIDGIVWLPLAEPSLGSTAGCDAVVADFRADMPAEWERFIADAALAGHIT